MNVRRSIAVATVLLAAPLVSSCAVTFGAQTDLPYNPAVGTDDRSGTVDVLNALIVSGDDGSGTVVAGLVNNDPNNDDTLKDVSGAGNDSGLTVDITGDTSIPAGGLLDLAKDGGVSAYGDRIKAGNFVTLRFTFDRGEAITLDVPVVSNAVTGDYGDVRVPTASPSS